METLELKQREKDASNLNRKGDKTERRSYIQKRTKKNMYREEKGDRKRNGY
jgi:hypothetical protein